jgi:hypothetical protein
MIPVSSLIAIFLLVLVVGGGVAVIAARYAGLGWPDDRLANARPALAVLFAVLAACLAGWLLAVALASP